MQVPLALVHHANQYLITDGYDNKESLKSILGSKKDRTGLLWILELHRIYKIPANIHISGTLLEAIVWHQPAFLLGVRELYYEGLLEIVGSCYGQNIMRFFSSECNLKQLNEELQLYQIHIGLDPEQVKTFWPAERLWDTECMAPVLKDPRLINKEYNYVILDDRLLLPSSGSPSPRRSYDQGQYWDAKLFQLYRIQDGQGLVALPIANNLRQSIPPAGMAEWQKVESQLRWLAKLDPSSHGGDFIAIYGDDMEKAAGIGGWNPAGPSRFEAFLRLVIKNSWIRPVKLSQWASTSRPAGTKQIEVGTFVELANHFHAGEGYEKWYFDSRWDPYRGYWSWSQNRVEKIAGQGADPTLIQLAEKHLLASSWETAWHTPPAGPHGDPNAHGDPSPWIKALASHSRHAALIAEAAFWMRHKDNAAHAYFFDVDNDGREELILKNDKLFAVVSTRWGGRLLYLFSVEGDAGKMVIGNPCDDWNWLEELNDYMDLPHNHPGALADLGFEHDSYSADILFTNGQIAHAKLENKEPGSAGYGLVKDLILSHHSNALRVNYALPDGLLNINIEFGLSPDYLALLRHGRTMLKKYNGTAARGCSAGDVAVWVRPDEGAHLNWAKPYQEEFGHGCFLRLAGSKKRFTVWIGIEIASRDLSEVESK